MGGSGRLYVVLICPYELTNASKTFGGKFESGIIEETHYFLLALAPLTKSRFRRPPEG